MDTAEGLELYVRDEQLTSGRRGLRFVREASPESPMIVETEEKSDGSAHFSGYLLRWGDEAEIRDMFGHYRERFSEGSLINTFNQRGPNGNNAIKLMRQHNQQNNLVGKFLDLHEDKVGAAFQAKTIDTDAGRNLAVEIREGVMNAMSIGFDSVREDFDKDSVLFTIREAKMYEASPVYWPAYQSGTIDNFRSLEQIIPAFNRLMVVLENSSELSPEQYRHLNNLRVRIEQVLQGPGGGQSEEDENRIEAPVNDHAIVTARLRLAEARAQAMEGHFGVNRDKRIKEGCA